MVVWKTETVAGHQTHQTVNFQQISTETLRLGHTSVFAANQGAKCVDRKFTQVSTAEEFAANAADDSFTSATFWFLRRDPKLFSAPLDDL